MALRQYKIFDGLEAFIRDFTSAWGVPVEAGDGISMDIVKEFEERNGVVIPAPLRTVYELIGGRGDLVSFQDPIRSPDALVVERGVLVFRDENQFCVEWAVGLLDRGDPRVLWRDLQASEPIWRTYQENLSHHLVDMVISEMMLSSGDYVAHREADGDSISRAIQYFDSPGIQEHVFWAQPEGPPVRWLTSDDVFIRIDGDAWIWMYARNEEALRSAQATLPGEWEEYERQPGSFVCPADWR
jgi:hypothetical protein